MRVAYTDPAWAVNGSGVDPARAALERRIYGERIRLDLGVRQNGGFALEGPAIADYVSGANALVVYRCQVTDELLDAAGPDCRVVARQGVGLDNLNAELLRERGIWGFHVPDYCGDEVGTHALALLLALERGVAVQDKLVKSDRWSIHAGGVPRRTSGLTAGIVGFGRIGRAVARKLEPFYGSLVAYDPYVNDDVMASHGVRRCAELNELMACADAVLLHADLNAETRGIVGAESLAAARPGALVVNTARGALVDPAAVLAALEDGTLGGFASDVFSPEDPNRSAVTRKLLDRDDVVVTAHRAFLSTQSEESLRRRVAEGVAHVLRHGEPPPSGRVA